MLSVAGTSATVTAITPATVSSYEPTAPFADGNGMVAGPNVDLANELVQLLVARYTFAANAQVIRADAQMSASLLNITCIVCWSSACAQGVTACDGSREFAAPLIAAAGKTPAWSDRFQSWSAGGAWPRAS